VKTIESGFSQPGLGKTATRETGGILSGREFVQVRFAGTAAQGVVLMGVLLAMAATRDHRYVAQTQTHGLEENDVHGHSDVIISDRPVDFPELQGIDLLVSLCQGSADAYVGMLGPESVFVYDSQTVTKPPFFDGSSFGIPFSSLAQGVPGRGEPAADMVALGATVAIAGVVSPASLRLTLKNLAAEGSREARRRALSYGLRQKPWRWQEDLACW